MKGDRRTIPYLDVAPLRGAVDADLVVVGAGVAGLMAAIQAHDRGARVIVVEMQQSPFYSESAICGGGMALPGTALQSSLGIEDSRDLLEEDLLRVGRYSNDREIVSTFCDHVLEAHCELERLGGVCTGLEYTGGHSVPRIHRHDPMQVMRALSTGLKERRIRVLWGTRARRLVVEPSTGRVVGLRVEASKRHVLRSGAVLVCTGGMCGNVDMLRRYVPARTLLATRVSFDDGAAEQPVGLGEGLQMAMAIGADTTHIYGISTYTGIPHPRFPGYSNRSNRPWFPSYQEGAIAVNRQGERFVDEPGTAPCEIGDRLMGQPEQMLVKIGDAACWERMAQQGGPGSPSQDLERHVWLSNSLETLADLAGVNRVRLVETVEHYNRAVGAGVDRDFGREAKYMFPIATPPFIAHKNWIIALHSSGGLRVTHRFQVLSVFGDVMPGLYAAGEAAGGLSGEVYLTGTHYAAAMTSGYLVGRSFVS